MILSGDLPLGMQSIVEKLLLHEKIEDHQTRDKLRLRDPLDMSQSKPIMQHVTNNATYGNALSKAIQRHYQINLIRVTLNFRS